MLLQILGLDDITLLKDDVLLPIDKQHVLSCMGMNIKRVEDQHHEHVKVATDGKHGSLVRECPDSIRIGFKAFKYTRWFHCDVKGESPTISFVQDVFDIRILARFRCGMSWLATEKNRHKGLGRKDRVCLLYTSDAADE